MFKKISSALLISTISASSYAYIIGGNFTIENKTNVPITVEIEQPNGQGNNILPVPAHQTSQIYMQNGDSSGLLYQTSTAPFTIKSNGNIYAKGRIVYYVGPSLVYKYSFLDPIFTTDGLKVDPTFSCKNGGYNTTFNNKIVIEGTPGNALIVKDFPSYVQCQGLKSSNLRDNNQYYTTTCSDGQSTIFHKYTGLICQGKHCWDGTAYESDINHFYPVKYVDDPVAMQAYLDKVVGNEYCETWQK